MHFGEQSEFVHAAEAEEGIAFLHHEFQLMADARA